MAVKFIERLNPPAKGDKFFTHYNYGGYSICYVVNKSTGWCLPNCVGLAHAYMLMQDYPNTKNAVWSIPACNAEDFVDYAKSKGYTIGMTPKLGAVACYASGKTHNSADGCGHVCVVQRIYDDGDLLCAESYFNGAEFGTCTLKKADGYKWTNKSLTFLGFIYPKTDFIQVITPKSKPAPAPTPAKEDYTKSTIPNRFKVRDDVKQVGSYTVYTNAVNKANAVKGIIVDSTTGDTIYSAKTTATAAKPAQTPAPTPAPAAKPVKTYVVKPGDSLWSIAAAKLGSGTKYPLIKEANKLVSNTIHPNQVLILP